MFSVITLYSICHLLLSMLCLLIKICLKVYIPKKTYVKILELIPYLILTCHMIYMTFTLKHEYCTFHHVCYGGTENMHYHSISYDSYTGCLDESSLDESSMSLGDIIIKYYDAVGNDGEHCENTEYGCCRIENRCQVSYEFNMSFTEYQKDYILKENENVGKVNTYITKNNPNGDNCLTHNDYINFYEDQQIYDVIFIYSLAFDGYIVFYIVLSCIDCCKDKHDFERVEQSPSDHTQEKGSV